MSSEISIETGRLKAAATDVSVPVPVEAGSSRPESAAPVEAGFSRPKSDDGFRPWHFFVLSSILLATVAVMLSRQTSPENLILISLTIAAAGAAAAAFYRMLVPLAQPFVLRMGEPVSDRARAALEREKMLVLRTIKELEFDRAMGKLSQKDFDEMAQRLRTRAVSLIKQLDLGSGSYAAVIEKELQGRLASRSVAAGRPLAGQPRNTIAARTCECGTSNDMDAVFCKKCGSRLIA